MDVFVYSAAIVVLLGLFRLTTARWLYILLIIEAIMERGQGQLVEASG